MKTTVLTLTAMLMASTAFAQTTVDDVIADFTSQGYTQIEIKTKLFTIEVDARKDGTRHRATYNRQSGELVSESFEVDGEDEGAGDGSTDEGAGDGSTDEGAGDGAGSGGGSGAGGGQGAMLDMKTFSYLTGGHHSDLDFG